MRSEGVSTNRSGMERDIAVDRMQERKEQPIQKETEAQQRQRREPNISEQQVNSAVASLNKAMETVDRGLRFELHDDTNRLMVRVVDRANDEVLREIPPEKILDMMAQIRDMVGLLIDERF